MSGQTSLRPPAGGARKGGGRAVAQVVVLTGVQFLVIVDSLAVALALPEIGRDLRLSPTGLGWVVNGYSLALAAGLLLAGRVSDVHGRRPTLLAGLALLTLGAVAAGLATSGPVLLAARVVQGAGAALAYPPVLALTSELFPAEPWRSRAYAAGAVAGASGTVAGAVFGGAVTGWFGWPWVFLLTVPPGVVLLVVARRVLPAPSAVAAERRLDLPGALLAASAVATAVLALSALEHGRLGLPVGAGGLLIAGLLLVTLGRWERRAAAPLLPPALLRSRRLLGGCLGIAANSALYSAAVFLGTLLLQDDLGFSPERAGLAFLPISVASLLSGALLVTRLRRRWGSVPVALAGLVAGAAALLLLAVAAVPARPSYALHVLPAFLLVGVALTAAFVSLTEHTVGGSEPGTRGVASGLFESATQLGGAVSVTVYAGLVSGAGTSAGYLAAAALVLAGATGSGVLLATDRR